MKQSLPPAVVYLVIAVVVIVVVVVGYKMLGPKSFNAVTTGSEALQQKVKEGGTLYQPSGGGPPNVQIPGRTSAPTGGQ